MSQKNKKKAESHKSHCIYYSCKSRLRRAAVTDLEADPGLQLPVGVEEAQQSQSGDAVGAASHAAAAARHPAEDAVLVIAEQPRATNQRHRAVHLAGEEELGGWTEIR